MVFRACLFWKKTVLYWYRVLDGKEGICLVKGIILGLYNNFSCAAGSCTSTCCSGWRIEVSNEAFLRFVNISNQILREDILSNIYEADGKRYFATKSNGRCSMLDNDGLCRIQKNLGEGMLCNTCRKFPRLISNHNGLLWISMAASCPVTADYIINSNIEFYMVNNNGNISVIDIQDIPFISAGILEHKKIMEKYMSAIRRPQDYIFMYKSFMDMADNILEVIIESHEIQYLDGCFDYFQEEKNAEEIVSQFMEFENIVKTKYRNILENYIIYRTFSRYIEMPEEMDISRLKQVFGELAFIYIVEFSRYYTLGKCNEKEEFVDSYEWRMVINWVYRLCAHGLYTRDKIHNIFMSL